MPEESPHYTELSEILGVAGWQTPTDPFTLPHINQLFLFNPKNRDFVMGNASHPDSGHGRVYLLLLIMGIVAGGLLLMLVLVKTSQGSSRWDVSIALSCNGMVWSLLIASILRKRQTQALAQKGKLMRGSLVKCTGKTIQIITLSSFQVTATYQFTAPDTGQTLTGMAAFVRNDLKNGKLPLPNTTVAVLYVDENHHRLM